MSVNIGSLVGTLKVIDEASGVIGKVQAGIGGLTGVMSKMGGAMGDVGGIINSAFSGFATGGPAGLALGAGVAILGSVVTGIQSCVKEATASEAVWASLGAAVGRTGESWQALKKGTEDALLAMSKVTTYSDEQLAQALEKLMTFGLSYDQAMQALGKTIDFAAAKHMDLESAATIVGKAMDGNTGILKRYGVDITSTKDAAAALKDVQGPLAAAFKDMGDNLAEVMGTLRESGTVTSEFASALQSAKDPAKFLIEQFQQGNIDLPQFTSVLTALGVPLDETKLKAGGAEKVLGALNKQFGGAAGEAAKTYAGTQERLKNATGEVSEKIGMMFLPALASLTEAFIPVVDGLGKGVDAIGSWLTEVSKMPEVKGFVEAAQGAFDGLWKGMQDFWGFLSETFGPVLQELGGALREVFDALAPIGEAFAEIWSAITGGQEGGDWLKDFLKFVAQFIREVVVPAIKEAVPVIKGFADAFKAAADFALPIITQIKDAVVGFIEVLKTTFYGFYQWLVGGSLWQDMWNALLSLTGEALKKLDSVFTEQLLQLGGVLQKVWDQLQVYLGKAIEQIQTTLAQGWDTIYDKAVDVWQMIQKKTVEITQSIYEDLSKVWKDISDNLTTIMAQVKDWLAATWQTIGENTTAIMQQVSDTVTAILTGIQTAFQDSFTQIQDLFTSSLTAIQSLWNTAWQGVLQIGRTLMGQATGDVQGFSAVTQATMAGAAAAIQSTTTSGWNTVSTTIQGALQTAGTAVQNFWNWLVNRSVWPEGLDNLIRITDQKMSVLQQRVQQKIADMQMQYMKAMQQMQMAMMMMQQQSMGAMAAAGQAAGEAYATNYAAAVQTAAPTIAAAPIPVAAAPQAAAPTATNVTLPVVVKVDGATIARVVQTRMVREQEPRSRRAL